MSSDADFPGMFDPAIDLADEEWCYGGRTTTVIGKPFVPRPIQVTFDGAIFTGEAELAFFYGPEMTPVLARNKRFRDGWMPVVEYDWTVDGLAYRLELFSTELPGVGLENLGIFAKLMVTNTTAETVCGQLAAGVRTCGVDYRKGNPQNVGVNTVFAMTDDRLTKDGQVLYMFSSAPEKLIVPGVPCQDNYVAGDYCLTDRTATGFSVYRKELAAGEVLQAEFKMLRVPTDDVTAIKALEAADYNGMLAETVSYWQELMGGCEISIPEKRVDDSRKAGMVHLMLATRGTKSGNYRQGSGLPYDGLFMNDYFDMRAAYDVHGLVDFVHINKEWLKGCSLDDGMLIDRSLSHGKQILTSHGQGLYSMAHHYVMTRDLEYAEEMYPTIRKAVDWIITCHESAENGLLIPSIPYDNEMIKGCYTSHNLHGLLGMRAAIRVARALGRDDDVLRWTAAHESYEAAVLKAIDWIIEDKGYIAPGFYDYLTGPEAREGFGEFQTGQDWENNLLVYPNEVLDADDPRVTTTLESIRTRTYREGVMSYRKGQHLHQYITINQAHQYLLQGDQKKALLDLYHVLLHNGSTHEGFENLVIPWSDRTTAANCPPPHAWAAAKTALFIRNMVIHEYGGKCGLQEGERNLHLYSLIAPEWAEAGKAVTLRNVPTEMGRVTSSMSFRRDGADVSFSADFHDAPRYVVIRIPYFVKLKTFSSDAKESFEKDGVLYFSADVSTASLDWDLLPDVHQGDFQNILKGYRSEFNFIVKDNNYDPSRADTPFLLDDEERHPAEPLSFELTRKAFLKEYKRRFDAFAESGGTPVTIAAPALLTEAERQERYQGNFDAMSLTVGKLATASANEADAHYANNGHKSNLDCRWEAPAPAWWQVDFDAPTVIDKIMMVCYRKWMLPVSYQFVLETSLEGGIWTPLVDCSDNQDDMPMGGYVFEVPPTTMKYLRVRMTGSSRDDLVNLVEVMAFGPEVDTTSPGE